MPKVRSVAVKAEDDKCNGCKQTVKDGDRAVMCDGCNMWFHSKCGDIKADLYNVLQTFDGAKIGTAIHWYCPSCKSKVENVLQEMRDMKMKQAVMENDLAEVRRSIEKLQKDAIENKEVLEMKEEVKQMRAEGVEMRKTWAEAASAGTNGGGIIIRQQLTEGEARAPGNDRNIQVKITEALERDKRKNSLIVMGIPEQDDGDDKNEIIENIVKELMQGELCRINIGDRIGKKGSKPRPVRVGVEDLKKRNALLSKARGLKEINGMDKYFICPDLTRQQQEEDKQLRDKLKSLRLEGETNIKINKGEIIRGEGPNRVVLFSLQH